MEQLESIAEARGFRDLLEERIKPVVEMETLDLRGVSTGNAVIVDYWIEWVPAREGAQYSGRARTAVREYT